MKYVAGTINTPGWRETAWSEVSFPREQSDNRSGLSVLVLYSFRFYCFPPSQKDHHFVSFHGISELYKVTGKYFLFVCVYLKILERKTRNFLLRQYNKS